MRRGSTVPGVATLQELLKEIVPDYGSQAALGRKILVSASRLSRIMRGGDSLEVVNCLRLADVTGRSASEVLQAAGKTEVHDLIQKLYGKARPTTAPVLTVDQRTVLDLWDRISEPDQKHVLYVMKLAVEAAAAGSRDGTPPPARVSARSISGHGAISVSTNRTPANRRPKAAKARISGSR